MSKIIPPVRGWTERTYYLVEVSFSEGNPVHRSVFYSGFLDSKGTPSGYNELYNAGYEDKNNIRSVNYMKAIRVLYDVAQEDQS